MSEIPPVDPTPAPPPAAPPPAGYSGYYRPGHLYGSAEKLQALSDGYFGLSIPFVINIVLALSVNAAITAAGETAGADLLWIFAAAGMFVVIGLLVHPHNKKIAFGKDWPPSRATLASVLMGLNSALCCGVIGYVVMQTIALSEMKKMGVKGGFLGVRKAHVQRAIQELKERELQMPAAPPTV